MIMDSASGAPRGGEHFGPAATLGLRPHRACGHTGPAATPGLGGNCMITGRNGRLGAKTARDHGSAPGDDLTSTLELTVIARCGNAPERATGWMGDRRAVVGEARRGYLGDSMRTAMPSRMRSRPKTNSV